MIDYYEELELDRNNSIDEIKEKLLKQEAVWKKREISNPEKATNKLALIIQARTVFETDVSRRKYDNDLEESLSGKQNSGDNVGESLKKWKQEAIDYLQNSQFDLAKVAIEKAVSFTDIQNEDDSLFALAADIYLENKDYQFAMDYINRAIVTSSGVSGYYLSKGLIYERQALDNGRYSSDYNDLISESRDNYKFAGKKADETKDSSSKSHSYGLLAHSFYFIEPTDVEKGEKYANRAIELGGDSWGNAERVLNAAKEDREIEQKRKEEELRKQEEQRKIDEARQKEVEAKRRQKEQVRRKEEKKENTRKIIKISILIISVIIYLGILIYLASVVNSYSPIIGATIVFVFLWIVILFFL